MVLIHKTETGWIPKLGLYLFPGLMVLFSLLYLTNESLYRQTIKEDGIVEWLTFTFLIAAGVVSIIIASGIRGKHHYIHWFFIFFMGFNFLAGMEEISWGQRVFDVETTGVFQEYSDQNEINLHNTFQGIFQIKTKHIALIVLFLYGSVLPGLMCNRKHPDNGLLRQAIIPPMFLRGGFTIAAILMLDFQTGHEEEIGEFFFSVCFFIMMLWNLVLLRRGYFRQDSYFSIPKRIPSLSE